MKDGMPEWSKGMVAPRAITNSCRRFESCCHHFLFSLTFSKENAKDASKMNGLFNKDGMLEWSKRAG